MGTFFSSETGKGLTIKKYHNHQDEGKKADTVFNTSRHHWKAIEVEVKAWVEANWERWEEEKPEWFGDAIRARVPVDYIPADGDARRRESVRRASVDAEAEGGLAGALTASIKRASVGGADGRDIMGVGGGKGKVSNVVPIKDEVGSD